MRVISQDGTMDFPYDNTWVSVYAGCINGRIYVRMQLCGYDDSVDVADYSTKEKARKAMEMLVEQYGKLEVMKVLASGTAEYMDKSLTTDEMIKHYNAYCDMNVFQFPQDDEIEV